MDKDFDFNDDYGVDENKPLPKEKEQIKRRSVECLELSTKYEFKRAFSEVKLLESLRYERLKQNTSYNFITGGDVDALSYLKIVLNEQNLDYLLFSTWCMAAEDILQIEEWIQQGKIKKIKLDFRRFFFLSFYCSLLISFLFFVYFLFFSLFSLIFFFLFSY